MEIRITVDDRIVEVTKRLCSRQGLLVAAGLLAFGSAIAYAAPVDPSNALQDGDIIYAADLNDRFEFVMAEVDSLKGEVAALQAQVISLKSRWIAVDTTWTVGPGADYETLPEAFAALKQRRILPSATLTLSVAAGDHALETGLDMSHPDGGRIDVVGAGTTATKLVFTGTDSAITVDEAGGRGLLLKELTLDGNSKASTGDGLRVSTATVLLDAVVIQDFGFDGARVWGPGAQLLSQGNSGVAFNNNGRLGLLAYGGASAVVEGASFSGNVQDGARADRSAYLDAQNSTATNNTQSGFRAIGRSVLNCTGCVSSSNTLTGFQADRSAFIWAQGASATDNATGFNTLTGSHLNALNTTATGNSSADYDPTAASTGDGTAVYQ